MAGPSCRKLSKNVVTGPWRSVILYSFSYRPRSKINALSKWFLGAHGQLKRNLPSINTIHKFIFWHLQHLSLHHRLSNMQVENKIFKQKYLKNYFWILYIFLPTVPKASTLITFLNQDLAPLTNEIFLPLRYIQKANEPMKEKCLTANCKQSTIESIPAAKRWDSLTCFKTLMEKGFS